MAFSAIIWGAGDNVGPVPVGATVNVTTVDGLQCSANSLPIGCLHATGPFMRFPDLRAQTRDSCSRQGKNRGCDRLITPPPPPPFAPTRWVPPAAATAAVPPPPAAGGRCQRQLLTRRREGVSACRRSTPQEFMHARSRQLRYVAHG